MQTFLPYPSFVESAQCLDRRRLGKQRVEVLQLVQALVGEKSGWANHPAAKMWAGHEYALISYGRAMCFEWIQRGYKDTTCARLTTYYTHPTILTSSERHPEWPTGFHEAHRSNLLRKDPEHYGQFGWTEPPNFPYVWPRR